MDPRALPVVGFLLLAALFLSPVAQAAPCTLTPYDLHCAAPVGGCDTQVDQIVGKAHTTRASADCRMGNMTRCHFELGFVGSVTDPTVDRWCAT